MWWTRQECHVSWGASHLRRRLTNVAQARRSRSAAEPVRITNAPSNRRDDLNRRRRRYLLSMSIRSLCFVGAVVVGSGPFLWVFLFGALILPYVAVVMANSAAPRIPGTELVSPEQRYRELES